VIPRLASEWQKDVEQVADAADTNSSTTESGTLQAAADNNQKVLNTSQA